MTDAHELRLLRIIEKLLTENERISNHAIEQTNMRLDLQSVLTKIVATGQSPGRTFDLLIACVYRAKEALAKIPA